MTKFMKNVSIICERARKQIIPLFSSVLGGVPAVVLLLSDLLFVRNEGSGATDTR